MSADTTARPPQDTRGTWVALTASQRGAAHQATGLPNQDAVQARPVGPHAVVAAVADGHGHRRHFRSARGATLAVAVACEAAAELAARLDGFEAAEQLESQALGTLVPAITGRWRAAVGEDLAARPFTGEEQAGRAWGDDPLIAYGSTLLLAVAGSRWLVLVQIGDGDIVGIQPGGRALLPVPVDPSLDGLQTTSLCGPHAEDEFRAAVVDLTSTALLGVLLATDGYGNAQAADPWADAVSSDLAGLIGGQPPEWLAAQLPTWASRCASAEGSADDTTVALLIAPSARRGNAEAPTVPVAVEPAVRPDPTTSWPRRPVVIGGAAVLIAGMAAFAAIQLSSPSGPAQAACVPPSSGIGAPVAGDTTTACDTRAHRTVTVSLRGLPDGQRVALQAGNSIFVVAGHALWWNPVDGPAARWTDLGRVPAGAQQELCLAPPAEIVVAAAAGPAGGADTSWAEVRVAAQSPGRVGPPTRVASNPCPLGHSR